MIAAPVITGKTVYMTSNMNSDLGEHPSQEEESYQRGAADTTMPIDDAAEIHSAADRSVGRQGHTRGAGLQIDVSADRGKAFRRARRHTWLVRGLKLLLPLGVTGLVGVYGVVLSANQYIPVRKGDKFDIGTPTLSGGKPSMKNPKYEGYNKDGSKFFVTAKEATPNFSQPDRLTMKSISGTFTQVDRVKTYVTAGGGLFDNKASILDLYQGIDIVSGSGLRMQLNSAKIFLKANKVVSNKPVAAQMVAGTIRANAMTLLIKKKLATFSNGVAVKLKPKPKQKPSVQKLAAKGGAAPAEPWAAKVKNSNSKAKGSASFGGASNAPIDVVAMTLQIDDIAHTARFKTSVRATQAGSTMTAQTLDVFYEGAAKKASKTGDRPKPGALSLGAASAGSKLKRILARGGVSLASVNGRRARARSVEFNAENDTATLVGDVVLTQGLNVVTADRLVLSRSTQTAMLTGKVTLRQGKNLLKGGRLYVDRKRATSQLTSPGKAGRIFATFYQSTGARKKAVRPASKKRSGFAATQFKADPNAPVNIIANTLNIDDKAKTAVFEGKVIARQGSMAIRADTLNAIYSGKNGLGLGSTALNDAKLRPAGNHPPTQLKTVRAYGSVIVSSKDGQRATGDWADFNIKANKVTLGGNVKLIQGSTELLGERLEINLRTGQIKLIPRKGGGDSRRMSLGGGRNCTRACLQIIPGEAVEQFKRSRSKTGGSSWGSAIKKVPKRAAAKLKSLGVDGWQADLNR